MASDSITSCQIDGDKVETVANFIFLGSTITVDSDYSHEIKRKAMTNLDSILKSKDITMPTKICIAYTILFPVVIMDVRAGQHRRQSADELMLLNCGAGKDS